MTSPRPPPLTGLMFLIHTCVRAAGTTYAYTVSSETGIPGDQVEHALEELCRRGHVTRRHLGYQQVPLAGPPAAGKSRRRRRRRADKRAKRAPGFEKRHKSAVVVHLA